MVSALDSISQPFVDREVALALEKAGEIVYDAAQAEVDQLLTHYQQFHADNATNPNPIRATFRLDGGFTSLENIYWLIEMGCDV